MRLAVLMLALALFTTPVAATDIGQPAPQVTAKELSGDAFDLAALRGKVVIVHFWATWCVPCQQEMPELESFYRAYHAKGVEMIAISADKPRDRDNVKEVMNPYSFPGAMLDDVSKNGFGMPVSLPLTYIIDRDGVVRLRTKDDEALLTSTTIAKAVDPLLKTP